MKILFVHQNFPGQFLHLAPALQRRGHDCRALTVDTNRRPSPIPVSRYRHNPEPVESAATRLGRNFTETSDRGTTVARSALEMRDKHGYSPDVILGHSGWGETLFLKEIWPKAKLIVYAEYYYRGKGGDVGFDPEFTTPGIKPALIAQARAAHLGQSLLHADAGLAPTHWQASTFPAALQPMIRVIFDGIDTEKVQPNSDASFTLPNGSILKSGDEILTFVNRNLEPYRGYHSFMRALPAILKARPMAQVVIVGGDGVSYGKPPPDGKSWRQIFMDEVSGRLDGSRVHFLGKVPYADFLSLMQVARVHAYLTYPFVLSWSMLEAMAAGALVVGSRTAPVEEIIVDGVNGRLVDFFDVEGWSGTLIDALAHPEQFESVRLAGRQTIVKSYDLNSVCLPRIIEFVEEYGPKV